MKKIFVSIFVSLFVYQAFSQVPVDNTTWNNIETAIRSKKNLIVTYNQLQDIRNNAWQQKDYISFARSRFYQMLITDQKTEDSLFFRNSSFIDSILSDPSSPSSLKLLMHVMQAQRLTAFNNRYLRFNQARYETKKLKNNYAAFSKNEIDSLVQFHFEEAKKLLPAFTQADPENLLWLSSNPLAFLFKPAVRDILLAEQIGVTMNRLTLDNSWKGRINQWLQLSPDDFIRIIDTISKGNLQELKVLSLYNEWLKFQRQLPSAYYYIETLARKYVYQSFQYDKEIEKLYEKYLVERSADTIVEVKAYTIYQLCLLWNSKANKLEPQSYNYYDRTERNSEDILNALIIKGNTTDTEKYTPSKALQLYESNKSLFEKFSYLGDILETMKSQILAGRLSWKMDNTTLPGEPILARIEYKNVPKLFYRIVRVNYNEKVSSKKADALYDLLRKPFSREIGQVLPLPPDNATHRTFLKIDPLSAGRYYILFSEKLIDSNATDINMLELAITQIAILPTDNRVYVLDRKTGLPIAGADVDASYSIPEPYNIKKYISAHFLVNKEGFIELPKKEDYELTVSYQTDTLNDDADATDDDIKKQVYDKKDDDLQGYYDDNAYISIFTDRSIYRPGQTVFYKAILMTKDPNTGESIIFNSQNTGKYLKKWQKEEKPVMFVKDPFDRNTDTIKIKPDDYGAMSGSFIIPKTAATGDWKIDPEYIETHWRSGSFKVEEYKRPSFELTVDRPDKTYLPGEPVSFRIKVRSFAGSALNNTKIKYNVVRNSNSSFTDIRFINETILDSTGFTNADGVLTIIVTDTAIHTNSLPDSLKWNFSYNLEATAADESGESHDTRATVQVSSKPVNINISLRSIYYINEFRPALITAKDPNGLELSKQLKVKIYKKQSATNKDQTDYSGYADQWMYPVSQLKQWFPAIQFSESNQDEKKELVHETMLNTGNFDKLRLPNDKLAPGAYFVQITCEENGKIIGTQTASFSLFDTESDYLPGDKPSFFHLPANYFNRGDSVLIFTGSAFDSSFSLFQLKYYSLQKKKLQTVSLFKEQMSKAGIQKMAWQIPQDATGQILATFLFIRNNRVYRHGESVWVAKSTEQPQIVIEQFRNKLTPGQTATFAVSVKTKNTDIAAEILSTMYDASLDKLEDHRWNIPNPKSLEGIKNGWPDNLVSQTGDTRYIYPPARNTSGTKPSLWWLKTETNSIAGGGISYDIERQPLLALEGRVPGLFITQANGLDEVIVNTAYSETRRLSVGNVSTIRGYTVSVQGINSIVGDSKPLIILDGVPYTGDLSSLKVSEITEAMILKDADATAIYGSRAASGALIISTKGRIVLPEIKQEPVVKIRNNFNETAFFYPSVHADKDGFYRFTFTMPESVTEWNWKLLAHTKKAQFAYAERKLTTQLPLMIQPNMPRLLYQGDHIILKSRISNLDSTAINGKAVCKIEDAGTGEDITSVIVPEQQMSFTAAAKSNTSVSFSLNIPKAQLNPIKITIKAIAQDFADAEEHIIPVLTDKILVRQSIPFQFSEHKDTTIELPVTDNLYGIGLSIIPKPQSALINSLTYLANYSYDCAEQTFNKMLANITALEIMRTDKEAQKNYELTKANTERQDKAELLPDQLSEQTMPWLNLANKTAQQQQQLFLLLDTARTESAIEAHLNKLYKLQNTDGGLTWFEGGESNTYISNYVLAGFGKLLSNKWKFKSSAMDKYDDFITKLIHYCDDQFIKENNLFYAYARHYWKAKYPVSGNSQAAIRAKINIEWDEIDKTNLGQQALLIISTISFFDSSSDMHRKALQQLHNIQQLAIEDEANGTRWKDIADADDLYNSTEESVALLSEAFENTSYSSAISNGVIKWLLNTRTDHHWSNTKATAAAVSLLQKVNKTATGLSQTISTTVSNKSISVSNDLLSGQLLSFTQTSVSPANLVLKKSGDETASGNVITSYFTSTEKLNQLNKDIQLSKKLYRYNESAKNWEAVVENTTLKIADKIKVILTIVTSNALRYVYIDDKRAGALEPVEQSSGYEYGSGFSYYKSVRDAGCQFFADFIPSGKWDISYELKVSQEGDFMNGPAMLQCMYKPGITAYSNSIKINTSN